MELPAQELRPLRGHERVHVVVTETTDRGSVAPVYVRAGQEEVATRGQVPAGRPDNLGDVVSLLSSLLSFVRRDHLPSDTGLWVVCGLV